MWKNEVPAVTGQRCIECSQIKWMDISTEFKSFSAIRVWFDDECIRNIEIRLHELSVNSWHSESLPPHVLCFLEWFRCYEQGHFQKPEIEKMRLLFGHTSFARDVYVHLLEIPVGNILTYRELAEQSGHAKACRAVGHLMAVNSYPIVLPCHRVISRTKPWQYAFGGAVKRELLGHEHVEILNDMGYMGAPFDLWNRHDEK